ncbi:hypothetical protein Esti_000920 [Eimeria stiedai]
MPFNLGDKFPNFDADAFGVKGKFNLYDYLGDSYELAKRAKEFTDKNCKLIGFSCNDMKSHEVSNRPPDKDMHSSLCCSVADESTAGSLTPPLFCGFLFFLSLKLLLVVLCFSPGWAKDILAHAGMSGELPFPIVCDPDRSLASNLGIMDPKEKDKDGLPLTCRSVFFIGKCKSVKASILYPATIGRSFKEILRVLEALELVEAYPVSTPVEWQPGQKVCVIPDLSNEEAKQKFQKGVEPKQLPSGKEYIRLTPDPRS